jgi:predicted RNase H-like HicB family nuclease
VQSARGKTDEEARENVIDALRGLLAALFGSPPELPDRTGSDSLELTIAA